MFNVNKVLNGDVMDVLLTLPEKSVDLIVADPFFNEWDKFYDLPLHVLKDDGILIAFSNRPHTGRLQVKLDEKLNFLTEVVWNFADGRWVSNKLPRICHENILIYTKSKKNELNDMRLLEWIDKPKQAKKGGASIGKWKTSDRTYTPQDLSQVESVIYNPRNVGKEMGIVSKPKELIKLLLEMTTKENDIVLDLFSGSGVVSLTAKEMGRQFIGVEIDKQKCEKIVAKLAEPCYICNGTGVWTSYSSADGEEYLHPIVSDCPDCLGTGVDVEEGWYELRHTSKQNMK
jgi:site-specific DNA-methyltransferase (adenine-specific)